MDICMTTGCGNMSNVTMSGLLSTVTDSQYVANILQTACWTNTVAHIAANHLHNFLKQSDGSVIRL